VAFTSPSLIFVESTEYAYSHIRRAEPNLIVLCLQMDDPEGFRVLSMLKLDEKTRQIPIVTCTSEGEDPAIEESPVEYSDEMFVQEPAPRMN
jgi:CheY-like chemotaxis protein